MKYCLFVSLQLSYDFRFNVLLSSKLIFFRFNRLFWLLIIFISFSFFSMIRVFSWHDLHINSSLTLILGLSLTVKERKWLFKNKTIQFYHYYLFVFFDICLCFLSTLLIKVLNLLSLIDWNAKLNLGSHFLKIIDGILSLMTTCDNNITTSFVTSACEGKT